MEDDKELEEIREIQKREEELRRRMQEAGCDIIQENGQRKYGGPPPSKFFLLPLSNAFQRKMFFKLVEFNNVLWQCVVLLVIKTVFS